MQVLEGAACSLGGGWCGAVLGLLAGKVRPSPLLAPDAEGAARQPSGGSGCRYLLRDSVTVWMKSKTKLWEVIDKAIEMEGWKLLFLLRLSPVIPYNLLNITMATTNMPFWSFALTSFFGASLSAKYQK